MTGNKAQRWLVAGLISWGAICPVQGQPAGSPEMESVPGARASLGARKLHEKAEKLIQEYAPEFRDFQEKISDDEKRISGVVARLGKNEIDADEAKAELLPLVEDEQEIRNSPDYLAAQAEYASPVLQSKLRKLVDAFKSYQRVEMQKAMRRLIAERSRGIHGGRTAVDAPSAPNAQPSPNERAR